MGIFDDNTVMEIEDELYKTRLERNECICEAYYMPIHKYIENILANQILSGFRADDPPGLTEDELSQYDFHRKIIFDGVLESCMMATNNDITCAVMYQDARGDYLSSNESRDYWNDIFLPMACFPDDSEEKIAEARREIEIYKTLIEPFTMITHTALYRGHPSHYNRWGNVYPSMLHAIAMYLHYGWGLQFGAFIPPALRGNPGMVFSRFAMDHPNSVPALAMRAIEFSDRKLYGRGVVLEPLI